MSKPNLIVVAGCNGSGKSTFSKNYVKNIIPFDFDKKLAQKYDAMQDSELRDVIARNLTRTEFETAIYEAFSKRESFCYETNFDANPVYWVEQAKKLGYDIKLYFYCLDSLEMAKQRVYYRTSNKGHFVADDIVEYKWKEGYKNLNLHYKLFDHILLIDNSSEITPVQNIFSLTKNKDTSYEVNIFNTIPHYAKRRFPKIYNILKK
jgi:predicted ABC-type ATPase